MSEAIPDPTDSYYFPTFSRWAYCAWGAAKTKGLFGRGGFHQVLIEADLPRAVSATIEQTVLGTRLWRREKREVAQELIAHFGDGLDAGMTAEDLVASYGNPTAAAKLIRRAKRRCRPLVWQAWLLTSRAFGLLASFYLTYALYLAAQRPNPSIDYLAELYTSHKQLPKAQQAWRLYAEGLSRLDAERLDVKAERWPEWLNPDEELTVEQQAEAAAGWLAGHEEVLDLFRRAAALPDFGLRLQADTNKYPTAFRKAYGLSRNKVCDDPPILAAVLLPHVQESRDIARLLIIDSRLAASRGNNDRVYDDMAAVLGVARHAGEDPILVSSLVEIALLQMAFDEIERVLSTQPDIWSDRQLKDLAHRVARPRRPISHCLDGELAMQLDIVQRVYSESGTITMRGIRELNGLTESIFPKPSSEWANQLFGGLALPALTLRYGSREEVAEAFQRLISVMKSNALQPLWERSETTRFEDRPESKYALVLQLFPDVEAAMLCFHREAGRRDGVLIGIALELARRASGDWPKSLDQLAPRYLPELPIDRINGGPLGYRLVEGRPMVYSMGVDGDDDSGRLPVESLIDQIREYYAIGPPVSAEAVEREKSRYDGDWVLWSLAEPQYMWDTRVDSASE